MINKKNYPSLTAYSLFPTAIGWCGMLTARSGLLRLYVGYTSREHLLKGIVRTDGDRMNKPSAAGTLMKRIKRFCSGENVSFEDCAMDWSSLSAFQQKVLRAARKVPYGSVETYGSLAERIGCPRGARAVGNALAKNPFPLVIPCHRIVRGDGRPGGFSAGMGVSLKKKLLLLERRSSR